jgi:hypothetical protein
MLGAEWTPAALCLSQTTPSSSARQSAAESFSRLGETIVSGGENLGRHPGHTKVGAPGPIAGAGLPVLAIGYGVYWLIKRRRKTD